MTLKDIPMLKVSSTAIFSYSCAAVDKITTNTAHRAIPLRELSFYLF